MVVRARSLAVLAVAAAPLAAAHPALASSIAGTPSFNCNAAAAGGTIDWSGDGISLVPFLGLGAGKESVQYNPLSCSDGFFSDPLGEDQYFTVKFGDGSLADGSFKFSSFESKIEDKTSPLFGDVLGKVFNYATLWDINLDFVNAEGKHFIEFLGIEVDSSSGFVTDGSLLIDSEGNLVLDPTNPGGTATVSLYDTPQIPEPATLLVLGTGLLGLGAAMRRRLGW